jgi:2-keto-3-deoxy-6-phosphogluconate aldolase
MSTLRFTPATPARRRAQAARLARGETVKVATIPAGTVITAEMMAELRQAARQAVMAPDPAEMMVAELRRIMAEITAGMDTITAAMMDMVTTGTTILKREADAAGITTSTVIPMSTIRKTDDDGAA